jgi:hypothetical protein
LQVVLVLQELPGLRVPQELQELQELPPFLLAPRVLNHFPQKALQLQERGMHYALRVWRNLALVARKPDSAWFYRFWRQACCFATQAALPKEAKRCKA